MDKQVRIKVVRRRPPDMQLLAMALLRLVQELEQAATTAERRL